MAEVSIPGPFPSTSPALPDRGRVRVEWGKYGSGPVRFSRPPPCRLPLNKVGDSLRVISLKQGANSRGAWELGLAVKGIQQDKPKAAYLLLADEPEDEELVNALNGIDFVVVQASYHSPATARADVVLPSPIWAERDGKYTSMDGRVCELRPTLQPKDGILRDEDLFVKISKKSGCDLALS